MYATFAKICTPHFADDVAHFQVQASIEARHAVTGPVHADKLLYIATFHWGLKITMPMHAIKFLNTAPFLWPQDRNPVLQTDASAVTWT